MTQLYTLEEARQRLNVEQCGTNGHDYHVTGTLDGPTDVACRCCKRTWKVQMPRGVDIVKVPRNA